MNIRLSLFVRSATLLAPFCCGWVTNAASLVLDENFRAPLFSGPGPVSRTLLLPGGKYLLFFGADTLADQRTGAITRYLADGTLDLSFSFGRDYKFVDSVAVDPQGKFYVSGKRYVYGIEQVEQVFRLNDDGSIDRTFPPVPVGTEPFIDTAAVRHIVLQPDGKILVAGYFNNIAGTPHRKISRLLPNGALDSTFTPPQFLANEGLWAPPHLLPDGKILIGGQFGTLNGEPVPGLARLNADGSVDSTFQPTGFISANVIRGIVSQSDGKIVIGGRFRFVSGSQTTHSPLIRLQADGSFDASFVRTPDFGANRALVRQPDGKMLGAVNRSIYRYNEDGSLDSTFTPPVTRNTTFVDSEPQFSSSTFTVDVQPDGRILFGGGFTDVDGPNGNPLDGSHHGVARLNADGTLDPTLTTTHKTATEIAPGSFSRLADGSTLVGFEWPYRKVSPALPFNIGRLGTDGSLDASFTLAPAGEPGFLSPVFTAVGFEKRADDHFLVFGVAENSAFTFGKVAADGSRAPAFGFDPAVPSFQAARPLPDGKMLIAAETDVQANVEGPLARLRSSGVLDAAFQLAPAIRETQIVRHFPFFPVQRLAVGSRVLAVQPDGRILLEYLALDELIHLVRLHPDGSLDDTFAETTVVPRNLLLSFPLYYDRLLQNTHQVAEGALTADLPFLDALVQSDGRMVLVGQFTSVNGNAARGIIRLQADGTVDNTFLVGGGAQWTVTAETPDFFPIVEAIEAQNDGKLLLAGTFEAFNGVAAPGIVSLNPDGSVDSSSTAPAVRRKFGRQTTTLARQPDGSFHLAGAYSFPSETEPTFIHINSLGGVPIIGSGTFVTVVPHRSFTYQIIASGQPTSYGATGLPANFIFDSATGVITGTPTAAQIGTYSIALTATNGEGTSAAHLLTVKVPAPVPLTSAVSRKYHGQAGVFDLPLSLMGDSAIEPRSEATAGAHLIVITFENPIEIAGEARVASGSGIVTSAGLGVDRRQYFVSVSGVTNAQTIKIQLSNMVDAAENYSPTVDVQMTVLAGDVNGNRSVNASDVAQLKSAVGQAVETSNFRFDVNVSGVVNSSDVSLVKANAGTSLPTSGGSMKTP